MRILLSVLLVIGLSVLSAQAQNAGLAPDARALIVAIDQVAPSPQSIHAQAKYFDPDDWQKRMAWETGTRVSPDDTAGLLDVMARTSFGVGAAVTTEAGCTADVLEREDFAIILAMWAGESRRRDMRREAKALIRAARAVHRNGVIDASLRGRDDGRGRVIDGLERLDPEPTQDRLKAAMRSAAGQFAKVAGIERDLLQRTAPGRFVMAPWLAERIAAHMAGETKTRSWTRFVPFAGSADPDDIAEYYIEDVAHQAERYYNQKVRLCDYARDNRVGDTKALLAAAVPYTQLSGTQRAIMKPWSRASASPIQQEMLRGVRTLRGALRVPRTGLDGTARLTLTIRRDGKILDWHLTDIDSQQPRFARQMDVLAKRAVARLRLDPFPYQSDETVVTRRFRLEFD